MTADANGGDNGWPAAVVGLMHRGRDMRRGFVECLLIVATVVYGGLVRLALADEYDAAERAHWSFQPCLNVQPPKFDDPTHEAWIRTDVDRFVLKSLREAGLRPAPEADRHTLARRVYFDLTGLPPTPQEIEQFVADESPQAYAELIERLLASPHYGERWAQHWLDVVRYAETEGFEYDNLVVGAWRFRDYVINSIQADVPYDQFVREQIAGDELHPENQQVLVAAGFNRLGPVRRNAGNPDVASSRNEVLTEMTNGVGAVFLGLTIGCARCHDHRFDPIRQRDYYQLQAYFAAAHERSLSLASAEEQAAWRAQTDAAQVEVKRLEKELDNSTSQTRRELGEQLRLAERRLPAALPTICTVADIAERRTPIHILERGNWDQRREAVGMRPLGVLLPEGAAELPATTDHPRAQLAEWLTRPDHPLTARVMVNRVWQWHFGRGIVNTPNDFGANGAEPSHPELLDYLARRFVAGGWRLKPLHRELLLSSTYRQASLSPTEKNCHDKDPANRLLWKFSRRRLEAEEIRDAMLAVSGRLNTKRGGPSVIVPVESDLVDLLYKPSQWVATDDANEHDRRSIYLLAKRNLRLPFMEAFDGPDTQLSCARRESSTHAPQALELLNGSLSTNLAEAFAARLERESPNNPMQRIVIAFQYAAGHPPTTREKLAAFKFLRDQPLREFALAMFNLNAFLYVD